MIPTLPTEPWDGVERRQAARFSMALPVKLDDAKGCTRDVSTSGVFFMTQDVVALGASIRFALELGHADPGRVLHVACGGMVLRVEPGPDAIGVAVHLTAYELGGQAPGLDPREGSGSGIRLAGHTRANGR